MQMQAENLRIYSLAYALWRTPAYLHAAQEIRQYLKRFLTSPEGGFYTSQDADLIEGRHSVGYFALSNAEIEITSADGGADHATMWIAKDSRKAVKLAAVLADMGGATSTAELVP